MRTAILSVLLAIFPVWSYAGDDPKPKPGAEQSAPQSPKATIPGVAPGDSTAKAMISATPGADPINMATPAGGTKSPVPPQFENSYQIGPEDQIFVNVWGNPQLTGPFVVAPDGRISFPLINEILVAGMTREVLQTEITRRLKEGGFLREPTVTVNVTGFNSKKYSIEGEVNHPGSTALVVPTTVLEALVNAGGFKDFANKSKIRILRGDKSFRFNYNQVINGKHREQNIYLQPGDLIIVK